jgi:aldehyde dehydrogenase (NAD+)
VRIANDTRFGLVAGVWSENIHTAQWTARRLEAGTVWINTYLGVHPSSPFGGHGASGVGREGGLESVRGFTEITNVMAEIKRPR